MALSERVAYYFRNPLNVGHIEDSSDVGTGTIGIRACGGVWMKIQIQVVDGIIVDAKCKTYGCATSIACSSYVTETIKGKRLDEVDFIDEKHIDQQLTIMPHKKHCASLAERTLKAAILNYRSKNGNTN